MKKLIVALMVLSTLASCGKDNKVSSGAAAATSNPATTAITTTDQLGVQLGQRIDTHTTSFGLGQYNYYTSLAQVANSGASIVYKYTKSTASASNPDCEKKWIFTVCTSSSTSSSSLAVSRTVSNSIDPTVLTAKMNELKAIINNRHVAYPIQVSGSVYYIVTNDNKQYAIDIRMPILANPTGIKNTDGSTEYMFTFY